MIYQINWIAKQLTGNIRSARVHQSNYQKLLEVGVLKTPKNGTFPEPFALTTFPRRFRKYFPCKPLQNTTTIYWIFSIFPARILYHGKLNFPPDCLIKRADEHNHLKSKNRQIFIVISILDLCCFRRNEGDNREISSANISRAEKQSQEQRQREEGFVAKNPCR